MPLKEALIAELKHESSSTRKLLEKVPLDRKDWKPHEKSMTLGRLATHVAEITHWVSDIVNVSDFDFMKDFNFQPRTAETTDDLLHIFETNLNKAIADLSSTKDEEFDNKWTVRRGEQVMFSTPKKVSIRSWALNHMIHHRGQLSVYLRLLDVPIPGMYGPSADEKM